MTVKYKQIDAAVGDNGRLEGYLSTWDRVPDSYGDVVKRGAFTGSLERWKASGKHIPLLFSHRMDDLAAYIGTLEADEDDVGLHFIADFDDTEEAQRVRSLYKDGRLSKFSFAYTTLDEGPVTLEDGTKANELRELDRKRVWFWGIAGAVILLILILFFRSTLASIWNNVASS